MLDFRKDVEELLLKCGYTVVYRNSYKEDPFEWLLEARKDNYKIVIKEVSIEAIDS